MGNWTEADEISIAYGLDSWRPTTGTLVAGQVSKQRRDGRRVVFADGKIAYTTGAAPSTEWTFPAPLGKQPVIAEFTMPAYVIWGLSTPVLWNTGRKHYEFALQLPLVLVGALAFYLLAGLGIHVAAAVAGGLLVLRAAVIAIAAFRALGLRATALLPDTLRGLLLSGLCIAGVLGAQHAVARFDIPLLSLACGALAAGVLPMGAVRD